MSNELGNPVKSATVLQGLGLAPVLCEHLEAMNFNAPTRIQQTTLPVLLVGQSAPPPHPPPHPVITDHQYH